MNRIAVLPNSYWFLTLMTSATDINPLARSRISLREIECGGETDMLKRSLR